MAPEIILFLHLMGFGLLATPLFGGILLEIQLRRTKEPGNRDQILRSLRSIGILSPIAMGWMLLTGIGNMFFNNYSMLRMPGWLAFKIVAFVLLVISGILFAIQSRKRSRLLQQAAENDPEAGPGLNHASRQITLAYIVLFVLILLIVYLSVAGVSGAQ